MVFNVCVKFHENMSSGFKVMEGTQKLLTHTQIIPPWHTLYARGIKIYIHPELQIGEGIEDNSKIFFLIFSMKTYVVTPH